MERIELSKSKKFAFAVLLLLLPINMVAWGWNPFSKESKTGNIESAMKVFIERVQYMTEREALSKGINYYKKPRITVKRKVRDLTGKAAVYECNLLGKENEESLALLKGGYVPIVSTYDYYKEKEYALDHPNDIVGAEYYFEGVFTHFNKGYDTRRAKVLCINGTWFVVQKYK
jgi:hypothetical protein